MKNKISPKALASAIGGAAALSLIGTMAFAASTSASVTGSAQVAVPVGIVVSSTTTAATTTTITVTAPGAVSASSSAAGGTEVNVGVGATAGSSDDNGVLDISASDASENSGASINSAADVSTSADLDAYARTLIHGDASIKNAYASSDEVSVTYARPVKLFGFIPAHLSEKAEVDVDAQTGAMATVSKSWWGFLASDANYDSFQTELSTQAASIPSAEVSGSLSASAKADILSRIELAAQASAGVN